MPKVSTVQALSSKRSDVTTASIRPKTSLSAGSYSLGPACWGWAGTGMYIVGLTQTHYYSSDGVLINTPSQPADIVKIIVDLSPGPL